jgi:hypothetical protein
MRIFSYPLSGFRVIFPAMDSLREQVRLLSIFHYVLGGIGYVVSLLPCIHLAIGIFFLVAPEETFQAPPNRSAAEAGESEQTNSVAPVAPFPAKLFGLIFTSIAGLVILGGLVFSTCLVLAGRHLAALRSHTFCLVMAGIECLFMPFGTALGIFTILTLVKPGTRELFGVPAVEAPRASG